MHVTLTPKPTYTYTACTFRPQFNHEGGCGTNDGTDSRNSIMSVSGCCVG